MEPQQLATFAAILSPLLFGVIALLSRPPRRIVGFALIAGLAFALLNVLADVIASLTGWWDYPFTLDPYAPLGFYVAVLFVYGAGIVGLVGWWFRKRFGLRSALVFLPLFALLGAVRDVTYTQRFPTLLGFGEGFMPVFADYMTWLLLAGVAYGIVLGLERTTFYLKRQDG